MSNFILQADERALLSDWKLELIWLNNVNIYKNRNYRKHIHTKNCKSKLSFSSN